MEGRDKSEHHRDERDLSLMDVLILGVNTASPGGCSTSSDARCEAGMLLKGPWDDPKPLAAASFRLTGSHPIRIAQGLILGLLGRR